ncbi:Fc receptor-like protein 5 [Silurus meridionalis]|nr:Fc receptor-like protein 5 [Silurus meridionalis]
MELSPKPVVIIKPDTQVFRGEIVTFRCEIKTGRDTEWNYDWYKDDNTLNPNHATQEFSISPVTDSSRGKYTCRGRRHSDNQISETSDSVTLTVSGGDVILDSPVHPVTEGNPLTLRCLYRKTKISTSLDFYKDESILQNQTTGVMTINNVSKSDEGFYHCKHPDRGESPKSWISVRG